MQAPVWQGPKIWPWGGVPNFAKQGRSGGGPKFSKQGQHAWVSSKLFDLTLQMVTLRCFALLWDVFSQRFPKLVLKCLKVCWCKAGNFKRLDWKCLGCRRRKFFRMCFFTQVLFRIKEKMTFKQNLAGGSHGFAHGAFCLQKPTGEGFSP